MEYLAVGLVLLLLIAGFVTFLVLNATKKSGPVANRGDEGPPGIGADDTPLGDTTQHAGEQSGEGTTVGEQDADDSGGTGRPTSSGAAGTSAAGQSAADPDVAAHLARPGEGEGGRRLDFEPEHPASERDA
jgi:hypothetical protein